MADKPIGKDATGYEILTDAMKALFQKEARPKPWLAATFSGNRPE